MKVLVLAVLTAVSMLAHAGGSLIVGGRSAAGKLVCFQTDRSLPSYTLEIDASSLTGRLVIQGGGNEQTIIPAQCMDRLEDSSGAIDCNAVAFTIYVETDGTASIFNSRGIVKNLTCQGN